MARSEYILTTSYDELSGGSSEVNRHDSLLNTALLVKSHTEYTGRQAVFPSLNFSCSGDIHKLLLVGRVGGGAVAPNFTLWQRGKSVFTPELSYSLPLVDLREVARNPETGMALFEAIVEREYFSGDMFGFSQPNSSLSSVVLQYQRGFMNEDLLKLLLQKREPRHIPTETTFANTKDLLVSNEDDTRILVDGVYWRERDHTLSKRFIDIV